MANLRSAVGRIREYGGNVIVDSGRLRIINREKLPAAALEYIKTHAKELGDYLECEAEFEERAAIIEYDGSLTRPIAEYLSKLLMKSPPDGVDLSEWSWFVGQASAIIDAAPLRRNAA